MLFFQLLNFAARIAACPDQFLLQSVQVFLIDFQRCLRQLNLVFQLRFSAVARFGYKEFKTRNLFLVFLYSLLRVCTFARIGRAAAGIGGACSVA